jgi:hypothetical protein
MIMARNDAQFVGNPVNKHGVRHLLICSRYTIATFALCQWDKQRH